MLAPNASAPPPIVAQVLGSDRMSPTPVASVAASPFVVSLTRSNQPVAPAWTSLICSLQVPFGSSPINLANEASGAIR